MQRYIGKQQQQQQQQHSQGDTSISNPEGLESYVVKHIIGKGSHSVVHLATCTRGRLRGRDVALKFIPCPLPTPAFESMHVATTALHKSLHHPAVVALHSAFTIMDYHCVVLELCEGGTLWDFLRSQRKDLSNDPPHEYSEPLRLSEAQLRPVLRSIIEGLSHLHSRGIIHQDVSIRKVFLTADGRAKLGGFRRTFPVSILPIKGNDNNSSILEGSSSKLEMSEPLNCSVKADLWSLGSLIITLLSGTSPEPENGSRHLNHAFLRLNALPENHNCSKEAEAVITALLKYNPDTRSPLDDILSLPFFHPTQQTQFLNPTTSRPLKITPEDLKPKRKDQSPSLRRGISVYLDRQPMREARPTDKQVKITEPHILYHMTAKPVSNTAPSIESRAVPLSHVASVSSTSARSSIRDTWTKLETRHKSIAREEHHARDAASTSETRVVGVGVPAPFHPAGVKRKALVEVGNRRRPSTSSEARVETHKNRITVSGLLSPPETHYKGTPPREEPNVAASLLTPSPCPPLTPPSGPTHVSGSNTRIPPANCPTAFKVPPLFPQTHKLAHGQLVVLPSARSLLIDLREGERRAGGRGDRVMCVSADGQEISVYDAPHLSTPCVLSEPLATWTLPTLPPRYWEAYIFAGRFVESVKKRTPWLIWYTAQAKFTLMSNGPRGDVHAAFPCPSPGARRRRRLDRGTGTCTQMRIVLSRARGTVEVARFTGGEWVTTLGTHPDGASQMGLTENEQAALNCVLAAVKVCEFAEAQCLPAGSTAPVVVELPQPEDTDG